MVLRFLMRYFANNEQLVQKLSESYPVRRAAQIAISIFFRSKNLAEEHKLNQINPDKFKYDKKKPQKTLQNNFKKKFTFFQIIF